MKLVVFYLAVVISPGMLISMEDPTTSSDDEIGQLIVFSKMDDTILIKGITEKFSWPTISIDFNNFEAKSSPESTELVITSEMLEELSELDVEIAESKLKQARQKSDFTNILEALSDTANKAVRAGNYNRALECVVEALQMNPANILNFIAVAGESLVYLSKSSYDLEIKNSEIVAQELYAIFYSYCRSSSASILNEHPLRNYIDLVLVSEDFNPKYSGWSLLKYCRYLATQFHYQKAQDRLLMLTCYLIQNGAIDEAFQEGEEIPSVLFYFTLKGGKRPVKGEVADFKYVETFSNNTSGPGPRGIAFTGKNAWRNIIVDYAIEPNPHQNKSYNKKQDKFYKKAAKHFQAQFQINNNTEPDTFEFSFGGQSYTASQN